MLPEDGSQLHENSQAASSGFLIKRSLSLTSQRSDGQDLAPQREKACLLEPNHGVCVEKVMRIILGNYKRIPLEISMQLDSLYSLITFLVGIPYYFPGGKSNYNLHCCYLVTKSCQTLL